MPVSARYTPKSGKGGEKMKRWFLEEVEVLQTCHSCVKAAASKEHILEREATAICSSILRRVFTVAFESVSRM